MGKFRDLTGQRFGRLVVKCLAGRDKYGGALWMCICDCGNITTPYGSSLTTGDTRSCGCLSRELTAKRGHSSATHGMSNSKVWKAWKMMRQRCANPNNKNYSDYGGRGIKVCDRWNSFDAFLADMGEPPTPDHTLDRINTNGDYEPGNCRWSTMKEQCNNRRSNRVIVYLGESKTMTEWAEKFGMRDNVLLKRLKSGWSIAKALTTPVRAQRTAHYRRVSAELAR